MEEPISRPQPRRISERWLSQYLLSPMCTSGLVLAVCLGSTWWLWSNASLDAERDNRADFNYRVHDLVNNIAQRMQTYVQVLYGAQGLYASSDYVDRTEFHRYVAGQGLNEHFPGIQGIGYMRLVEPGQRDVHLAGIRSEGFPDYAIRPAGERPQYAPIVYLEPFDGVNLRAFGYDPLSEPVRRAALELARDTGLPAMSGKITLVQETSAQGQSGFLIVLPVYRNGMPHSTLQQRRAAIVGWLYSPFRIGDVMAGIGGDRATALDVEIYDGDALDVANRMYDSVADVAGAPVRRAVQKIRIAGHRWTLRIGGLPGSGDAVERNGRVQLIGVSGVVLSGVLAALAWLLAHSRRKSRAALEQTRRLAEELAEGQANLVAMAESAQRSQQVLRSILDSTVDGILVDNFRGAILNSNRRFRELWNVPEQLDWQTDGATLMRHVSAQLVYPPVLDDAVRRQLQPNEEQRAQLHLKDGRVLEHSIRGICVGNESVRLWSFRDITERTHSERREQMRRHVLELLASGAPLEAVLHSVVQGVEADNPGMLCALLLLDEEGRRLLVGAAPSLPAFFNAALHGHDVAMGEGCCDQTVITGQRVIVENLGADPLWWQYRDLAARAGLKSCWSEPIRGATGKILGTFAIFQREAQRPSLAHLTLIEQASRLAGITIEQAQAGVALRAGEARFRSLYDNAPVALWEQDWSAVHGALQQLRESGVEDIPLFLQNNPSQLVRMAALVRIVDVNAAALAQVGAAPGAKDLSALSLAQNFDVCAMPAFAQALAALLQGAHLFSCESTFLRLDGATRQNELTLLVMPGHTHNLDFVIVSTVDITERKRMNDELLLLATTDFLTGLPNRREFMARLEDEQARLQRDVGVCGGRAAVLMLDIDHFKRVNDEYGHAAGDAVLRHMAAQMRDCQRKIDILGRVGGEEFAVLLPGADVAAALAFAERLRQRIGSTPLAMDGHVLAVTVSIGIATMDARDQGGDAALIRADKALYRAKRGGRNRVELAGDGSDAAVEEKPEALTPPAL
ncbi:MAG: CHASE domain-containing protein [Burkholderiaceae bacterium]|nr:CHASE domain-containing protein [Burkholderiaceae bacterium]